jgi:hypothetical protein
MRFLLALAMFLGTFGATARGQQTQSPGKADPTDTQVMSACGGRLARVFAQFGTPSDARVADSKDAIILDYDSFAFMVRDKTVRVCYFWSAWNGTVKGIKIGDTREATVKVLGAQKRADKNSDGVDDYGWEMRDYDATLWVVFDKDNKVTRIQLELN